MDPTATSVHNESPGLGGSWYPVALSSEVADAPVAVHLLGRRWVLARLADGLAAFPDACPHRLYPLSRGSICDGALRCAYHAWEFAGDGTCVRIPSATDGTPVPPRAHLAPPAGLVERYGAIWMAPDAPRTPFVDFGEWDDDRFEVRIDTPVRTTAGAFQATDNFCDTSHFLSVHAGTFGGGGTELVHPRSVERDGWTVTGTYEAPYTVLDDPRVLSGELPSVQPTVQTKTYWPATSMLLRMHFPLSGSTFTVLLSCQPEARGRTRIYRWWARDDIVGDDARWADCLAVEQAIMDEDCAAFAGYLHDETPLDLTREVHVAADKLSLGCRRVLAELVDGHPVG